MNGSVYKRCPCEYSRRRGSGKRQRACQKEHGRWYFSHDLPQLPGTKRRRVVRGGFGSKVAAQQALLESLRQSLQRGLAAERDFTGRRMLLADYLPRWLEGKTKLKPTTRLHYQTHIDKYLMPYLGHLRLEEIGASQLEGFYAKLRKLTWPDSKRARQRRKARGDQSTEPRRRLSPAAIHRIHATLRSALNDAIRRYRYLDHNPATYVELEAVRTPKRTVWTGAQAGRFLDAIEGEPLYPLYHLAVTRGLRRGELAALRWEDLDLDNGLVEVCRNLVQVGYELVEGTPKSQTSSRIIALDPSNVEVLRDHRQRQLAERRLVQPGYEASGDDLVFAREDGSPLQPEFVSRHFEVLRKTVDVPKITFHQLRHTAASLMFEAGAELKYVQHVLGHSDITITAEIYVHVLQRLDKLRSAQVAGLIPRQDKPQRRDVA